MPGFVSVTNLPVSLRPISAWFAKTDSAARRLLSAVRARASTTYVSSLAFDRGSDPVMQRQLRKSGHGRGAKDKRDYVIAKATISTWPTDAMKEFEKLMERTRTTFGVRNVIAHYMWKKDTRACAIKPINLSARRLKREGMDCP